jgi:hypothetical protein
MNPLIQLRKVSSSFVVVLVLACFALPQRVHAVSPAPDGGYPGGNTAEGQNALLSLTTGGFNTAVGLLSLRSDTIGSFNTAIGAGALLADTGGNNNAGSQNTATGAGALLSNTMGLQNTADGAFALFSNTDGVFNTADGAGSLLNNTHGFFNSAFGFDALASNTTGSNNTAIGGDSLLHNTSGSENTAIGGALLNNTIGSRNTALGPSAGESVLTASNVICIGFDVTGLDVDNSCFIGSIRGVTTQNADAIPVLIDSNGQLGTASSSRRYKTDIKRMDKASESILALKPVSFHYKIHKGTTPQFGLIAEDVAKVNPDLVVRDKNGEIYTVRYDAVNAMLLNEFLKEHRKVEQMQKQIDALTVGLQKVSAQLEVSKPASQTVVDNQ